MHIQFRYLHIKKLLNYQGAKIDIIKYPSIQRNSERHFYRVFWGICENFWIVDVRYKTKKQPTPKIDCLNFDI